MDSANIKLSIKAAVQTLFENASLWVTPYTVYGMDDLQTLASEPTRPFMFLLLRKEYVSFKWLPIVALSVNVSDTIFQLGSTSSAVSLEVNVITRSDGETTRIVTKIRENLRSVEFFDYTQEPPVSQQTQDIMWIREDDVVPPEYVMSEGTLMNWVILSGEAIVI